MMTTTNENLAYKDNNQSNIEPFDFRAFVERELMRRCRTNPSYSLRSYARSLNVDNSTLAKVISGKRKLGNRAIKSLGLKMGLTPEQINVFLKRKGQNGSSSEKGAAIRDAFSLLESETFSLISSWYHYAILELTKVKGFQGDANWIANSLGIRHAEASEAIRRLFELEMLVEKEDGSWVEGKSTDVTNIGEDMSSAGKKAFQKDILKMAETALEEVPYEERSQTSMTFAVDSARLPEAMDLIKEFRRKMSDFMSKGEQQDRVYQLGVSFYPVTQIKGEE